MSAPELDLEAIHDLCIGNEQRLQVATQAGCFDCMSIFPAVEVKAWLEDKPVRSALCPKCSSDAVLADGSTTYNSFADALEAYKQKKIE